MAVKLPNPGLSLRGFGSISASGVYSPPKNSSGSLAGIVSNFIFEAHHDDLMPTEGGALFTGDGISANNGKGLDTTKAAVQAWNAAHPTQKVWVRVRIECGVHSAPYLLKKGAGGGAGGTGWTNGMPFVTSGSGGGGAKSGTMPVYFDPAVVADYFDFVKKLGAYVDAWPEALMVTPGLTMLEFAELFWRFSSIASNVTNYHKAMAATPAFGLNSTATGSHTLTEIDFVVMQQMLDAHAIGHPNTYVLIDSNGYDNVDPLGTTATSKIDFAQKIWAHWTSTYPTLLLALTNASGELTANGPLYSAMQALGPKGSNQAVLSVQTYPAAKLATLAAGAGMTVAAYRAAVYARFAGYGMSSLELPDTTDTTAELTTANNALLANMPSSSGAPSPPAAPTVAAPTPGHDQLVVAWTDGANNGAVIDDEMIQYRTPVGSGTWTTLTPDAGTTNPQTIGSLTDGTTYGVHVRSHNSAGWGPYSSEVSGTPTPSVATAPTITATGSSGQVDVGITPPTSTGGSAITDYTLQRRTSAVGGGSPGSWGAITHAADPTGADIIDTTVTNNTSYDYRCAAVNGVGTGAWSNIATATPTAGATAPDPPSSVTAYAGDGLIQASWPVPNANGAPIDQYTATPYQGVTAGTPVVVTGVGGGAPIPFAEMDSLTNGLPYTVQVTAHNSAGTSSPPTVSNVVVPEPAVIPGPPIVNQANTIPGPRPSISERYVALLKQ